MGFDPGDKKGDMGMRAVRLVINPFDFISLLEVKCSRKLNEHGVLTITGLIEQEKGKEYMSIALKETWVSVIAVSENDEMRRFFSGILTDLWMKKEGQVYILTIEVKTGSFLLDIEQHTRSFQNINIQYSEAAKVCMDNVQNTFNILDEKDEITNQFVLQYRETNWEFMKRLASHAGTVLIPEDSFPEKKVYWGYRNTVTMAKLQADSYQMEQDYESYEKKKATGVKGLKLADLVSYVVRTREIYNLGETVQFEGMKLVIGKIDSWLEGQELCHQYYLITKESGLLLPIFNHNLSGISLRAKVIAVEKTKVKVQIEADENKEECGSCWFDYATVYSTPDGTGWYCMPEIGDEVRIVMPDCMEKHAYVASSVHLGTAGGRTNPDEKSWKNRQNKEILFTPDSIILRNNNGTLMELSDHEGIKLVSSKDISVQSDGNIQIKSQNAGVNISAGDGILMQQGTAKVQVNDEINICGGKIYMN